MCGAANLYRQSAMSFNLYFHTLLSATLSQADGMSAQQVETAAPQQHRNSDTTAPQQRHYSTTAPQHNSQTLISITTNLQMCERVLGIIVNLLCLFSIVFQIYNVLKISGTYDGGSSAAIFTCHQQ